MCVGLIWSAESLILQKTDTPANKREFLSKKKQNQKTYVYLLLILFL